MMDRNAVLEKLQPYEDIRPREVTATARVEVADTPSGFAFKPTRGARLIDIGEAGLPALYKRTGIPNTLANRVSNETVAKLATEVLTTQGEHSVLVNNGEAVDFADSSKYRRIPADRMLANIERGIPADGSVEYTRLLHLPNQTVQLEVVGPAELAVARGDIIRPGVNVRFSSTGLTAPEISPHNLRLICTNGLTSYGMGQSYSFTGGEGEGNGNGNGNLWNWVRRTVRDTYRQVPIDRFREMEQTPVSDEERVQMVEALIRRQRLNSSAAAAVRARALQFPPQNIWEVFNLGTWASSHLIPDTEPRQVIRAQVAASDFVTEDTHSRVCPTCNRGGATAHEHVEGEVVAAIS